MGIVTTPKKAGALEQNKQWTSCIMSSGIFIKSSTFVLRGGVGISDPAFFTCAHSAAA